MTNPQDTHLLHTITNHSYTKLSSPATPTMGQRLLASLLIILGLFSGWPFLVAGMHGGYALFHSTTIAWVFGIGTLYTVGLDGAWAWFAISRSWCQPFANHTRGDMPHKRSITLVAILLSCSTCIAPVYAAYITSNSFFLPIITLTTNFAYRFFGYQSLAKLLVAYFYQWFSKTPTHLAKWHQVAELLHIKRAQLRYYVMTQKPDTRTLLRHMLLELKQSSHSLISKPRKVNRIVYLLLPAGSAIIDFYLTMQFLIVLTGNLSLAISGGLLSAIPDAALSIYAAFKTADTHYNAITANKTSLLSQLFPNVARYTALFIFMISFTAPASGGYITYTVLGQYTSPFIQYFSLLSIIAARLLFSNFSQRVLLEAIAYCFKAHKGSVQEKEWVAAERVLTNFGYFIESEKYRDMAHNLAITFNKTASAASSTKF